MLFRSLGPALAVSVVYAGVTGYFARAPGAPWATALAFGGVHGFGLATALRVPGVANAANGLAPYALGVGLAEVLVLGALIAMTAWAHRTAKTKHLAPRIACAAAALVGLAATARALVA